MRFTVRDAALRWERGFDAVPCRLSLAAKKLYPSTRADVFLFAISVSVAWAQLIIRRTHFYPSLCVLGVGSWPHKPVWCLRYVPKSVAYVRYRRRIALSETKKP